MFGRGRRAVRVATKAVRARTTARYEVSDDHPGTGLARAAKRKKFRKHSQQATGDEFKLGETYGCVVRSSSNGE